MTPKQAFMFMKLNRLDFISLMLLEQMAIYPKEVLTNKLVNDVIQKKLSSPATVYKYLARLKRRKYIKEVKIKDQDQRCHYIVITGEGKSLLKEWV